MTLDDSFQMDSFLFFLVSYFGLKQTMLTACLMMYVVDLQVYNYIVATFILMHTTES